MVFVVDRRGARLKGAIQVALALALQERPPSSRLATGFPGQLLRRGTACRRPVRRARIDHGGAAAISSPCAAHHEQAGPRLREYP